ncbi:M1 family metallopeptidase [Hymenobacter weizhouensis]|uniref:M1 family metallopeptidase n=1 Tax=Hymenobacter sp. YIM 151500-1 TaxID=2987689 RepID=UPI002226CF2B|nr:M1 family metallopeptidase [Hymenobacter sp. YIM 151500-1]UYZ64589.1 M1 family aminopeptidase [Hymenobacter sp. YIM 151500-1]
MTKAFLLSLGLLGAAPALAQTPATSARPDSAAALPYRETARKINALVHTRLDVRFDYTKRQLLGKAWLTLQPVAYATDSLRLDAKGMDIKSVTLVDGSNTQTLKYQYNQEQLNIRLGRLVAPSTPYTVYIEYVAKPDELKAKGSAAITDAKGLYFINPDSTEKGKPRQIWTQGETEASSAWFPTIDKPNQKTTSEISMTVPARYVTLSNGRLDTQQNNPDGTRTDTWKMEQPHAPYLFMMAVGDFRITKDTWRGKEVSYYLEPKYAPFAKQIFGHTPEMLEFFSKRLGVEFPWNKYAQVVVRDYVSGAMENTTATIHGEFVQKDARELLDAEYDNGESVIAHELFHQWFGDLVTAESWSNLTVNESFADFSEALWAEHKYGQETGDAHAYQNMRNYLRSPKDAQKQLVRFHYADKEDMFDLVSYQKGGQILTMLRNYLTDDVFFAGLTKYLTDNKFGTGEAHQLRLALEAVSGQDLNWFFNQWYFGAGHPVVTIDYSYDAARKEQTVTIRQTQPGPAFQLPLAVDVYVNGKPQRHQAMLRQATETLRFPAASRPQLVNVDADKVALWQKTDNKPFEEFVYQYQHAPRYIDRREALAAAAQRPATDAKARQLLLAGLSDKNSTLRQVALAGLKLDDKAVQKAAAPVLRRQLAQEKNPSNQAALLGALAQLKDKKDEKTFSRLLQSSQSYTVQGAALQGLAAVQPQQAVAQAQRLQPEARGQLTSAVASVYAEHGDASTWAYVRDQYDAAGPQGKFQMLESMLGFMVRLNDPTVLREGVERMQQIAVKYKQYGVAEPILGMLDKLRQSKPADQQPVVEQAMKTIMDTK